MKQSFHSVESRPACCGPDMVFFAEMILNPSPISIPAGPKSTARKSVETMEAISVSATTTDYPQSFSATRNTNLGETSGPASRAGSNSGAPAVTTHSDQGGHKSAGHQDTARSRGSKPRSGGPESMTRAHGEESKPDSTAKFMVSNPGVQPDLVFGAR